MTQCCGGSELGLGMCVVPCGRRMTTTYTGWLAATRPFTQHIELRLFGTEGMGGGGYSLPAPKTGWKGEMRKRQNETNKTLVWALTPNSGDCL